MAVIKEFDCLAHGGFDACSLDDGSPPPCPHGCGTSMVQRVFRTPPTIQSAGYRSINKTFESLAAQHGLTNMNNRASVQDGIGMQRATPETYRRLNEATNLIMHASRSGQKGADASQYFQPLTPGFNPATTGGGPIHAEGGVVRPASKGSDMMIRDGGHVLTGNIPLNMPKLELVAAPFDGTGLGVPQSDA